MRRRQQTGATVRVCEHNKARITNGDESSPGTSFIYHFRCVACGHTWIQVHMGPENGGELSADQTARIQVQPGWFSPDGSPPEGG